MINAGIVDTFAIRKDRPDLDRPMHQIGGEPFLVGEVREIKCPICQIGMPFFAAISNETMYSSFFTENDYAQVIFHLCQQCSTVAAYSLSD